MIEKKIKVEEKDQGKRIDQFLGENQGESRSHFQKMIKENLVLINEKPCKANYRLQGGEDISFFLQEPKAITVAKENIPVEFVYQDSDIAVINKPRGMVVHPAAGNYQGTLVNALLYHCQDLSGINGEIRPGIVHRIDKDTSGLLVIAKNDQAHLKLAEAIKKHEVKRIYYAILHGVMPEPEGIVEAPIGRHPQQRKKMAVVEKNGKMAVTHYKVLERFSKYTLVEVELETGRTHQIRVHMGYLGFPVLGDPLYGPKKNSYALNQQMLHAKVLAFNHPRTQKEMVFEVPLPADLQNILFDLRKK